jgi:hypothetical protein
MNKFFVVIIVILLAASLILNVCLGFAVYTTGKKYQDLAQSITLNERVSDFASLLIDKVLKSNDGIAFEDRVQLENAIQATKDKQLYDQWEKFVNAQTLPEGKTDLYDLIQMIINKLSIK